MRTLFKIFMVLCLLIGVGIVAILVHYYNSIRFDLDQVVHYTPPLTTQIIDRKGRLVANLYDKEFRFYATFEDFPARVIEALAAVEDTLFFEHPGINIDAISRAMVKNLASGKMLEGGSTITQQLIKNIVLTPERTFDRKIKEALLAIRIEQVLSKEEILERYLNRAYFGHGYYGIRTAALGYFRKDLDRLTLKESALLAGLVRAPAFYDPTKNLDFALGRANNILQRMYALGWITDDELQRGIDEVPKIYNDTLSANVAPYVVNEVLRQLAQLQDIKTGGYVIKLNLDLDYQEAAQEALVYGYEQIRKRQPNYDNESLNGAIVVLENRSGRIRAMVGGVDYKKSNFNRVTQAKRQPGSSFKPFIYQAALDYSYSESDLLADIARTYEYYSNGEKRIWQPKNYTNAFKGLVTLKTALEQSLNLATINLVEDVGFERIWQKIDQYGFIDVPRNLTIALGSFAASPLEMSRSYTMFSNYGTIMEPMLIDSITDMRGKEIRFYERATKITEERQAFLMIDLLRNAVNRGTGRRARVKGIEIAGKTGSTNGNVDAWFCGFSPTIQTVVWYGRDDNTPLGARETGGVASAPVFSHFYERLLQIEPGLKRNFNIPSGVYSDIKDGEQYFYTDVSAPKETEGIYNQQLLP